MNTTSTKDSTKNSVSAKTRVFPAKEPGGRYWTGNKIRKSSNTNISSRKNDGAESREDKQDLNISSRKISDTEFLEDKQDSNISSKKISDTEFLEDKQDSNISSKKISDTEFLEDKQDLNISSRKKRRLKGDGSGCIYYRTSIKNGKEYHEAYFQYEFWKKGDCLSKSSRYIPKKLLKVVQELNQCKAPVREILAVLGEIL
ncbi:hypothetical protein NIES2101_14625 [Calothrix sp. HK-06]|nr:hypothetical protein NIES2101_14625 [Calothrix sp. HK-06]